MGSQQEFCLKWNNHQSNMLSVFDHLLASESFVDVTLAGDGYLLKAHKVVLSACSPYFRRLLEDNPCQHPIVILADVRHDEMRAIIEFMYKGEVNVTEERLSNLLKTAETLKIKGLAEVPSVPPPPPPSSPPTTTAGPSVRQAHQASFPRQSLSSGRRKRKPRMMKHVSSFNHRQSEEEEVEATTTTTAQPNEMDACLNPLSLDIVKVESMAPDDDIEVVTNEFEMDSAPALPSLPPPPPPGESTPLPDIDHLIGSSNHDSLTVVCSEKRDELGRFIEDDGGNVRRSGHDVATSGIGGPSTSTEKKPKKKKSSWTVTDLMRAIESVRSGRMNVLKAAMTFKIPKSSLYDYVNGRSGARLRLLKRMRPFAAAAASIGSGGAAGYVARALPFLNPEAAAAAAILASGELSWPLARMRMPETTNRNRTPLLSAERHRFSPPHDDPFQDHEDDAAAAADDDEDDVVEEQRRLLAFRELNTDVDIAVAAEEIVPSSMMDDEIGAPGSP